jgi:DMSO/TMAO reductase YedYZ heme-binding membrane subunit
MKTDPTFWLLARATGLTAYVLLTASVLAGLVLKSRPFRSLKPASVTDTHRFLALLGLLALAGHGLALVLDRTVRMPLAGLVVPGMSPYRPLAVAVGVVAAELMLAVYVSFALRRRIGTRNWRRLHWATYAIFAGATAHGVTAGTDTAQPWARALYLGAVGAVVFATAWRVLAGQITTTTTPTTTRRPAT